MKNHPYYMEVKPARLEIFNQTLTEVVVLLVLLTWWQNLDRPDRPYEVIEFYAGVGRIAAFSKHVGMKSAAVDLEIGKDLGRKRGSRPPMDINGSAGLLLLGSSC